MKAFSRIKICHPASEPIRAARYETQTAYATRYRHNSIRRETQSVGRRVPPGRSRSHARSPTRRLFRSRNSYEYATPPATRDGSAPCARSVAGAAPRPPHTKQPKPDHANAGLQGINKASLPAELETIQKQRARRLRSISKMVGYRNSRDFLPPYCNLPFHQPFSSTG